MKRSSFLALIGGIALIGSVGCRSAQSTLSALDDIGPSAQVAEKAENSTQPAETFQVSLTSESYQSDDAKPFRGTSIGRLPISATARNPRLCITG